MIIHVVREITWRGQEIDRVINLRAFKSLDTANAFIDSCLSKKNDKEPNVVVAYQITDLFLVE